MKKMKIVMILSVIMLLVLAGFFIVGYINNKEPEPTMRLKEFQEEYNRKNPSITPEP